MGLAIVDIDGVLADVRHRVHFVQGRPKDWDAFFAAAPQDVVLPQGLARVTELAERGELLYLTGRPERCRRDTRSWLIAHGFPKARLVMRPDRDRRPARFFKLDQVQLLARDVQIDVVVDDDPQVVAALRAAGFPVEHAEWMSSDAPQQRSLLEAQEREGRT